MKVAIVIPIHPPYYSFIYNLIDTIDKNNIDIALYLVFSDENDYMNFNKKDKIKKIVIPNANTNNIVVYKKFYAMKFVLKDNENYDYFIVCDAEINIIPENFTEINILNKINNIYETKLIYAGESNDETVNRITKYSAELICKGDNLKNITLDYKLYYWWSDLPVYKREHLDDFFSKFNYDNICFYHFDHNIYINYLILYHNFTILNLTNIIDLKWSLESFYTDSIEKLNALVSYKYGFSYITTKFYKNNKEFLINQGSFLLYHLDRGAI